MKKLALEIFWDNQEGVTSLAQQDAYKDLELIEKADILKDAVNLLGKQYENALAELEGNLGENAIGTLYNLGHRVSRLTHEKEPDPELIKEEQKRVLNLFNQGDRGSS